MPLARHIRHWWDYRHCPHSDRRCVHGDEINAVGGKRAQCLWCDRYLPALPHVCSVTGKPHPGRSVDLSKIKFVERPEAFEGVYEGGDPGRSQDVTDG